MGDVFMRMIRRIFLFLLINMIVVLTLSTVLHVLGVKPYITAHGLDMEALLIFCFIWGVGGALISLALSRKMAKWIMRVQLIDPQTTSGGHSDLLAKVYKLAKQADLPVMPQVGIYDSPEVNAFATGPSKRRALVAVSSGLLNRMSSQEIEGVLAHEVSHIANGDMITMTLIQGVINAFVMFLARLLAYAIAAAANGRSRNRSRGVSFGSYYLLTYLFEIVFLILGSIVVGYFSRRREFRADKGGAYLAGTEKMIAALESLKGIAHNQDKQFDKAAFQSLKISTPKKGGLRRLFSTHPDLDERIARLKGLVD